MIKVKVNGRSPGLFTRRVVKMLTSDLKYSSYALYLISSHLSLELYSMHSLIASDESRS